MENERATTENDVDLDLESVDNSSPPLRGHADSYQTKKEQILHRWRDIRENLLGDVKKQLQRQDDLLGLVLKKSNDEGWASEMSLLPINCEELEPRFRKVISQKVLSRRGSVRTAGQVVAQVSADTPPTPRGAWYPSSGTTSKHKSASVSEVLDKKRTITSRAKISCAHSFHNWEYSEKHAQFVNDHRNELQKIVNRFQRQGGMMSAQVDKALGRFVRFINADEPTRKGCMASTIESRLFNCLCTMVIIFDSIFTAIVADYAMNNYTTQPTSGMRFIEILLVIFYASEVSMKIYVHRMYFFTNLDWAWNMFDLILVIQGIIDVILTQTVDEDVANVQFMRLIRLLKIGKVLRLVRAVRFFQDLRVMVKSIAFSVSSMFWAFVMFALILYIAALFFVQTVSGFMAEEHEDLSDTTRDRVHKFFGSVGKAALTLYQSASGGIDWEVVYDVVTMSGTLSSVAFIFFIWFFNFAVLNILSGIFIEKAMAASVPDREQIALAKRRQDEKDAKELTNLITSMDIKGTGTITLDDFLVQAHDEYANAYLKTLEISVDDATLLFNLLRGVVGTGELPIADFVQKLVRVKGTAKALDLQSLSFEVSVIRQMLSDLIVAFSEGQMIVEEAC